MYVEIRFCELPQYGKSILKTIEQTGGEIRIVSSDGSAIIDGFTFCLKMQNVDSYERFFNLQARAIIRANQKRDCVQAENARHSAVNPILHRALGWQPKVQDAAFARMQIPALAPCRRYEGYYPGASPFAGR